MFPPCSSYPTLGTHGTRLRFRALACGPTPLASATFVGTGCGASPAPTLGAIGPPVLGLPFWFQVASPFGGGAIHVFWALGPATAGFDPGWGGGCQTYLDLISVQTLLAAGFEPLVTFFWSGLISSGGVDIPNDPALAGLVVTTQALISNVSGVPTPIGAVHVTNAMELSLGY
jgi:hypothetical protein